MAKKRRHRQFSARFLPFLGPLQALTVLFTKPLVSQLTVVLNQNMRLRMRVHAKRTELADAKSQCRRQRSCTRSLVRKKSRRTEQHPGVILYGGFASFSVPIGWISHVIMHSNMASSLEKMDIVGFNNFEESIDMGNITASWPALGSLEKLKPKYIYYSYADLQNQKSLRRQRLMRDRQDPFFALGPNDIRVKFKFYPHTIMDIVSIVAKDLQTTTKRNNPLTPKQTVCVSLYVLGHGRCKNVQLHTFDFNFLAQMSKFCIRNFIRCVFLQVKKCLAATFTMFTHHVGKFCLT